jgi:hypothetical protein
LSLRVGVQLKGICEDCGLSSYLFNIIINDIPEFLDTEGTYSTVINGLRILGLLFADELATASFTNYRPQKKIELVDQDCKI